MTTIEQALEGAAKRIDRSEAKLLMTYLLGVSRTYLITHDRDPLTPDQRKDYEALVLRREKGEPVPYIVGSQEFYSRSFQVTPDTLIPRPDTETLIETVVHYAQEIKKPVSILDLGTGSGCIAITLALQLPQSRVSAADISQGALQVAQSNASSLGANVRFFHGSWFNALNRDARFDLIVSNPPYIHPQDEHLQNLRFEPIDALTDHKDGLSDLREIITQAPQHLNQDGWLFLEHGFDQGQAVRDLLDPGVWKNVKTVQDWGNNDRVTLAQLI